MRNESYGLGRNHGVLPKNYNSGLGVWQGGRSPNQKAQNISFDSYPEGVRRPSH